MFQECKFHIMAILLVLLLLKKHIKTCLPGDPVVRTPGFHCQRFQVQSPVGELISPKP